MFTFMKLRLNEVSFLLESEQNDIAHIFIMHENVWFKFLNLKSKKNTDLDILLTDVLFFDCINFFSHNHCLYGLVSFLLQFHYIS